MTLGRLGFRIGEPAIQVKLVCPQTVRWSYTSTGNPYPILASDTEVMIEIDISHLENDTTLLCIFGPEGLHTLELPAGQRNYVQLTELTVGNYLIEVVPQDTRFKTVRLPFGIAPNTLNLPSPEVSFVWEEESYHALEKPVIEADLSDPGFDFEQFKAPPNWPFTISWHYKSAAPYEQTYTLRTTLSGDFDLIDFITRSRPSETLGGGTSLRLDFAELGEITLHHRRILTVKQTWHQLAELVDERMSFLASETDITTPLEVILRAFIRPVIELLGYTITPLPQKDDEFVQERPCLTANRSLAFSLQPQVISTASQDAPTTSRGLLVLVPGSDLKSLSPNSPRRQAEILAKRHNFDEMMLTDGRHWAIHQRGKRYMARPIDLTQVVQDEEVTEEFLARFAAEELCELF